MTSKAARESRYFKITIPTSNEFCVVTTVGDLCELVRDWVFDVDDEVTIKRIRMTEKEFKDLGGFDGF